jgi:hypothetical protein
MPVANHSDFESDLFLSAKVLYKLDDAIDYYERHIAPRHTELPIQQIASWAHYWVKTFKELVFQGSEIFQSTALVYFNYVRDILILIEQRFSILNLLLNRSDSLFSEADKLRSVAFILEYIFVIAADDSLASEIKNKTGLDELKPLIQDTNDATKTKIIRNLVERCNNIQSTQLISLFNLIGVQAVTIKKVINPLLLNLNGVSPVAIKKQPKSLFILGDPLLSLENVMTQYRTDTDLIKVTFDPNIFLLESVASDGIVYLCSKADSLYRIQRFLFRIVLHLNTYSDALSALICREFLHVPVAVREGKIRAWDIIFGILQQMHEQYQLNENVWYFSRLLKYRFIEQLVLNYSAYTDAEQNLILNMLQHTENAADFYKILLDTLVSSNTEQVVKVCIKLSQQPETLLYTVQLLKSRSKTLGHIEPEVTQLLLQRAIELLETGDVKLLEFCCNDPGILLSLDVEQIHYCINNLTQPFQSQVRVYFEIPDEIADIHSYPFDIAENITITAKLIHISRLLYLQEYKRLHPEMDARNLLSADQDDNAIKLKTAKIRRYFINKYMPDLVLDDLYSKVFVTTSGSFENLSGQEGIDQASSKMLEERCQNLTNVFARIRSMILEIIAPENQDIGNASEIQLFIHDNRPKLIAGELAEDAMHKFNSNEYPFPAWRWVYDFAEDYKANAIETAMQTFAELLAINYEIGAHYERRLIANLLRLLILAIDDLDTLPKTSSSDANSNRNKNDFEKFVVASISLWRREYSKSDTDPDTQSCYNGIIGRLFLLFRFHPIIGYDPHELVCETVHGLIVKIFAEELQRIINANQSPSITMQQMQNVYEAFISLDNKSAVEYLLTTNIQSWSMDASEREIKARMQLRNQLITNKYRDVGALVDAVTEDLRRVQTVQVELSEIDYLYIRNIFYAIVPNSHFRDLLHEIFIAYKTKYNNSDAMLHLQLERCLMCCRIEAFSPVESRLNKLKLRQSLECYVKQKIAASDLVSEFRTTAQERIFNAIWYDCNSSKRLPFLNAAWIKQYIEYCIQQYGDQKPHPELRRFSI